MNNKQEVIGYYQVEKKEVLYFLIKLIFSVLFVMSVIFFTIFAPDKIALIVLGYAVLIMILFIIISFINKGLIKGYIKNNSILINENQLPEIHSIVGEYCGILDIRKKPKVFLLESGGQLNAFVTRLHSKNYVVIYADLLEEFYNHNEETVRFVIAHELGHIKQKHLVKSALTFPSIIVPFLNLAYSRACEYTCDNIGAFFSPIGAEKGILTLAAGRQLNQRINKKEFINQIDLERGFWSWFVERISTHPNLNKRLKRIYKEEPKKTIIKQTNELAAEKVNKYMPK